MDLTELLDPRRLPSRRWLQRVAYGVIPLLPDLVVRKALFRGDRFRELMQQSLQTITGLTSDPTFRELTAKTGRDLRIVATDITRRRAIILPQDIKDYSGWGGSEPEDLPVSLAVRMSMAIPWVFEPVRLPLRDSSTVADIIDGGVQQLPHLAV